MKRSADGKPSGSPSVTRQMMADLLSNPRFDIPYFSHEPLNQGAYPGDMGNSVGPAPEHPLPEGIIKTEGSDSSCGLPDGWGYPDSDEDQALEANLERELDAALDAEIDEPAPQEAMDVEPPVPQEPQEPKEQKRKPKKNGNRPITSKKVVADMDSDDELLWNLKLAKWTEKQIHARFIAEGRTGYSQKTIGTRFCRMKKAMVTHVDQLLETGETDWYSKDDHALSKAVEFAEDHIRKLRDGLDNLKWHVVSEKMKEMNAATDYSGKACRDRFEAHMSGTATIPLDLRPNSDAKTLQLVKARMDREAKLRELEHTPR